MKHLLALTLIFTVWICTYLQPPASATTTNRIVIGSTIPSPVPTATHTIDYTQFFTITLALAPPTATPTIAPSPTPFYEPTPVDPNYSLAVPILMYHYLSEPPAYADAIRLNLSVTPTLFEEHLAYLQAEGYETISLETLYLAMTEQRSLPEKPIILSFDDGYRDAYEYAFPLLKKYDYTATFFVFTQPIDTYNIDFLTWEMITEMHEAGMEFGSHSYTHPDMRNRDVDFLIYQILGSKEAIEARIGKPVKFFCYPSGKYDQQVIDVLASANFWGAVTTRWGSHYSFANRFEMSRIRMNGGDTAVNLAAKLP